MKEQTGIRDYMQGEKVVQTFLAAYLGAAGYFALHTETELGKGYADIVLEPLTARYPGMRHGFVIELKYVGCGAAEGSASASVGQAERQLHGYLADGRLALLYPETEFKGMALVFRGWELASATEVLPSTKATNLQSPWLA